MSKANWFVSTAIAAATLFGVAAQACATNSPSAKADANAEATGGKATANAAGGEGGAGGNGYGGNGYGEGGNAINGGNQTSIGGDRTTVRVGAITGAPSLANLAQAGACNASGSFSVGGGAPLIASGGVGWAWADVAGVALKDSDGNFVTIEEVDGLAPEQRKPYVDNLSSSELATLTCILEQHDQEKARLQEEARRTDAQNALQIELKKLDIAGNAFQAAVDHACTKNLAETRVKRSPEMSIPSKEEHDKCHEILYQGMPIMSVLRP